MPGKTKQSGQILPVIFAIIAIALAALILSDRVATAMADQSRMADAADSAAYSAAVWTARRLNFVAYTNRAMLANHISVGHIVAYISWLRYVEATAERIDQVAQWLALVGIGIAGARITSIISDTISAGVFGSTQVARGYILATNTYNLALSGAQVDALALLEPSQLHRVKKRVVEAHDPTFTVNSLSAMATVPGPWSLSAAALLTTLYADLFRVMDVQLVPENDPMLQALVNKTIDHDPRLRQWVSNREGRGWRINLANVVQMRKLGNTERPPSHPADNWASSDRFQWRLFQGFPFPWGGWATLSSGSADAAELAGIYKGITGYTRIRPSADPQPRFVIPAMVTTDDERTNVRLSLSAVEYQVPPRCGGNRCPSSSSVATLFNPYWNARLISLREFF